MMTGNRPFLLRPAAKDYLWGGTRLNDDFGKDIPLSPLAETWECSTHPDGQSTVVSGEFAGEPLGEVLKRRPDFLGSHPLRATQGRPELPILIKLIDAEQDLSIQVHPDDAYARVHENALGKTEMWYVLKAEKDAKIVYGFNQAVTADKVRKAVEDGTIARLLQHVPARKDDLFYIEAGTVHAIGAGVLLAEIQESSNLTYRLYDYGRTDKHGNARPLHLDKALAVANLAPATAPHQPMRVLRYKNGSAGELLTRCPYFQVDRLLLNTEVHRRLTDVRTGANSFQVLLCTEGCGVLFGDGFMLNFFKGDCLFTPANSIPLKLHGKAQLLSVNC